MTFLFVALVLGFAAIGITNHGPIGALGGAFVGFCLFLLIGFVWFLWSAMSVNDCREYGHPSLSDMSSGESCSDEDIRWHVEHR